MKDNSMSTTERTVAPDQTPERMTDGLQKFIHSEDDKYKGLPPKVKPTLHQTLSTRLSHPELA